MEIRQTPASAKGIRFFLVREEREVARAFLYILWNDLHNEPFGVLEDVFVEEDSREQGIGTEFVQFVIAVARREGCYKLVATSRKGRSNVHRLYQQIGFQEWGSEFRMDFQSPQEGQG